MEKNCLKVCDLNMGTTREVMYQKLSYRIPFSVQKVIQDSTEDIGGEDEDTPWIHILKNVSMRNIHLFQECQTGKKQLKKGQE